jgi:hypothetical protein
MGRKGVSKRKSSQTKSKPYAGGAGAGSVSSALQAPESSQPAKFISKPADDRKKAPKKG